MCCYKYTFEKENALCTLKFRPYEKLKKMVPLVISTSRYVFNMQNNERGEEVEKKNV